MTKNIHLFILFIYCIASFDLKKKFYCKIFQLLAIKSLDPNPGSLCCPKNAGSGSMLKLLRIHSTSPNSSYMYTILKSCKFKLYCIVYSLGSATQKKLTALTESIMRYMDRDVVFKYSLYIIFGLYE